METQHSHIDHTTDPNLQKYHPKDLHRNDKGHNALVANKQEFLWKIKSWTSHVNPLRVGYYDENVATTYYTTVSIWRKFALQVTWLALPRSEVQAHVCLPLRGERYYNTPLCCDSFSSPSEVLCTFSVLCMYSKFGHHPHPLRYLCAKFCFFRGLHCWANPWRKIMYSIIRSLTQLIWCPGNRSSCTSEYVFIRKTSDVQLHRRRSNKWTFHTLKFHVLLLLLLLLNVFDNAPVCRRVTAESWKQAVTWRVSEMRVGKDEYAVTSSHI